jgi:hypothetical protein
LPYPRRTATGRFARARPSDRTLILWSFT